MSIHGGTVIVLENVTEEQVDLLRVEVARYFESLPEPDFDNYRESDASWHAWFNLCADLGAEGYEV